MRDDLHRRGVHSLQDPIELSEFGSGHYGSHPPLLRKEPDRGKKVLFLILAVAVLWTLMLAGVAGQYGADIRGALETHKKDRAESMLKETVKALNAYSHFEARSSYVLYCELGLKSAHLALLLRERGIDAFHVKGGTRTLRHAAARND